MSFNRGSESDQYRKHGPRLDPILSARTEERLKNPLPPASYGHYEQPQNGAAAQAPARTLQEIEAELRASAQKAREQSLPQGIPQSTTQPLHQTLPQQPPAPPPQPAYDQIHAHQRQLSIEQQFRNPLVMQPPMPLQQFPQPEQMQMYQQHQYMINNVAHLPPALQQQLLAQADFPLMPDPRFIPNADQSEAVLGEAMRKIMEAEQMEARRRRKAAKIARMVSPGVLLRFTSRV